MMKIADWLTNSTTQLQSRGIHSARLDCLLLLEDVLGCSRVHILTHLNATINPDQLQILKKKLNQRAKHMPLAYIRGFVEFYGRHFGVTKKVLIPRPESETIIELLKKNSPSSTIIDVGTGSGCLAITAKLEFPSTTVFATDIDDSCLDVAQRNARMLKADIVLKRGNLLNACTPEKVLGSTIVANLPYVPTNHPINQAAEHEPRLAIFAGEDGLDLYRELFAQAVKQSPLHILTESLPSQHELLATIAYESGYTLQCTEGYVQAFTASEQPRE